MENLQGLDHVAYVRFASVYKDFADPDEFINELKNLKTTPARL
jgi:transcriptional repressor NrdR